MTNQELKAELEYCYLLNDKIRNRMRELISGFTMGIILSVAIIAAVIYPTILAFTKQNFILAGVYLGGSAAALVCIGVGIFEIVGCVKELKKCDEMDKVLEEQEQLLLLHDPDPQKDITA